MKSSSIINPQRKEVNTLDNNYNFPVALQPIYQGDEYKLIPGRKAVVRTDTLDTLGIVSDEYGLVKHSTVIDSFREAGRQYGVEEKIALTNNGANLFYQMTFPKIEMEVKKGDIIRMMMIAKNSYSGINSLQIIFGAFRLVCLNGMVIGTQFFQFKYRHVGNVGGLRDADMIDEYKEAYQGYIKLFGEKAPEITKMAQTPLQLTDGLFEREQTRLPEYMLKEAKTSFETEKDNSVWGYYNALTYAITHKNKSNHPGASIYQGMHAWKAAERLIS